MATTRTAGYAETSRALQRYSVLFRGETERVLRAQASRIEERLRAEHKWRNRTGTAERALHAAVIDLGSDGFRIVAGYDYTAPYSVYLELAMQQRFAVLEPVMRSQWPATARAVAAAIRAAASRRATLDLPAALGLAA